MFYSGSSFQPQGPSFCPTLATSRELNLRNGDSCLLINATGLPAKMDPVRVWPLSNDSDCRSPRFLKSAHPSERLKNGGEEPQVWGSAAEELFVNKTVSL